MRRKEFLENVAVPLLGIAVVMFIVYLFCVENGVCDYRFPLAYKKCISG